MARGSAVVRGGGAQVVMTVATGEGATVGNGAGFVGTLGTDVGGNAGACVTSVLWAAAVRSAAVGQGGYGICGLVVAGDRVGL